MVHKKVEDEEVSEYSKRCDETSHQIGRGILESSSSGKDSEYVSDAKPSIEIL